MLWVRSNFTNIQKHTSIHLSRSYCTWSLEVYSGALIYPCFVFLSFVLLMVKLVTENRLHWWRVGQLTFETKRRKNQDVWGRGGISSQSDSEWMDCSRGFSLSLNTVYIDDIGGDFRPRLALWELLVGGVLCGQFCSQAIWHKVKKLCFIPDIFIKKNELD